MPVTEDQVDNNQELRWVAERLVEEAITSLGMNALASLRAPGPNYLHSSYESIEEAIVYLQRAQTRIEEILTGLGDE